MCVVFRLRHSKAAILVLLAVYMLVPRVATAAGGGTQQFRLGTAAMPFGWSTAIADLDSDENLDFAIADRTGRTAEGYNYSLHLALSHEEGQTFHFRSSDSALNISIIDLDNDADLDVVLTHAVSGEIAGIWINNGRGGFHQAAADEFLQARLAFRQTAAVTSEKVPTAIAGLPTRKAASADNSAFRFERLFMSASSRVRCDEDSGSAGLSDRLIASRAPPTLFPL